MKDKDRNGSRKDFDAIFVGSGHNALVAAAYLARAGWRVLVLEKNDRPGGLVRTEELTLPGFRHDVYASAHPLFVTSRAWADLGAELESHGLVYDNTDVPTGVSMPDGATAVFTRDFEANAAEAERLAPGDGDVFRQMMGEFFAVAPQVFELFAMDLASPQAAALMRQLFVDPDGRRATPFAADVVRTAREVLERFRSPVVRAMFAPWALHLGRTPDEPGSGVWIPLTLSALMAGGMAIPLGGSEMLVRALARLIEDHGGVLRMHSPVERIVVEGGRAVAVRTAEGREYRAAEAVVASVNPDQLYLRLLAADDAPAALRGQASRWRYGRGAVQIQLALSRTPRWADERFARIGQPHLTSGLDALSRQVSESIRGLLPDDPTISLDIPTVHDPSRAPEDKAILRLQLLEIPCRPRGDAAGEIEVGDGTWTEDLKRRFADRVIGIVGRHLPDVPDSILACHVTSPDDLTRFSPNQGPGDPYGGSHELAQSYLFRPLPGQPSHRTPIGNLYMLGAATWPGHGVNAGSGYIVAQMLLGAGVVRQEQQIAASV
jgi:phytoene dehydrogenase-like protein